MHRFFPTPLLLTLLVIFISPLTADEKGNVLSTARDFLDANVLLSVLPVEPADYSTIHSQISDRPDPESKFGYIVFSIARHSGKLLSPDQAEQLDTLIEKRQSATINWHDVRNMVRVKAQMAMWDYAGETNEALAGKKKALWNEWSGLRLTYMEQEFVDKERFQRAAWNILTHEQRTLLLSGAWDEYLKKSTGHGRLFSADKQINRVLGKPEHADQFSSAETEWRQRWDVMWAAYQAESLFERKREFAMDLAEEALSIYSWRSNYAPAFRAFAEHECEAIRDLLQSGYDLDEESQKKLNSFVTKLATGASEKYVKAPAELLILFP